MDDERRSLSDFSKGPSSHSEDPTSIRNFFHPAQGKPAAKEGGEGQLAPSRPSAGPPPPPSRAGEGDQLPPPGSMGPMELLSFSMKLYRLHFKTLMMIVAIVTVPFFLLDRLSVSVFLQDGATGAANHSLPHATSAVTTLLTVAYNVFIYPFVYGALLSAGAAAYIGEMPTIRGAYRIALNRLMSIVWVLILETALIGIPLAVGYWAWFAEGGILPLRLFLAPAAFALTGVLYVRWLFSLTAVVVEGRGGTRALARAWRLSAGAFWKIAAMTLLVTVVLTVIAQALRIVGDSVSPAFGSLGWLVRGASSALSAVLKTPLNALVALLLYFDQRVRKHDLDALPGLGVAPFPHQAVDD